ncbi:MAG: PKD domain-containing protein [Solirubrobacterales bacterium]
MIDYSRRRRGQTLILLAVACVGLALGASGASAANLCVGPGPAGVTCGPTPYTGDATGLQQAITDSAATGASDKIYLASGAYAKDHGWNLGTGNDVQLIGHGAGKPQLTNSLPASSDSTLFWNAGSITVSNVAIEVGAAASTFGIDSTLGAPTIKDVDITGPGSTGGTGILIAGQGATVQRATIDLPYATADSTGIRTNGGASTTISDLTVNQALNAVILENASNNVVIQRLRSLAANGVSAIDSWGTVSSSLFVSPPDGTAGMTSSVALAMVVDDATDYTTKPLSSNDNTIIGNGLTPGTGVLATGIGSGSVANVLVNSTVDVGMTNAFDVDGVLGGAGSLAVDYSRYTGAVNEAALGAHASALAQPADALFANAAGGDYTLQKASPLVDAGDPAALAGSATDLAGNPRIASRGAGNIRDIGAYELPNSQPVANIAILTADPTTTSPVSFSAAGSTDADSDPLTFAWKFDTNLFNNGQVVARTLIDPGPHTVQLTVTDSTGSAATISQQFNVDKGTLTLALNKKALRATGKGNFAVKLACPDGATSNCNGKLLFKTTGKKPLKAAQYVFSVEPGTTRSLSITTYKSFRKLLIKKKKLPLQTTLTGTTGNASLTAAPTTFKLSAPKPRR